MNVPVEFVDVNAVVSCVATCSAVGMSGTSICEATVMDPPVMSAWAASSKSSIDVVRVATKVITVVWTAPGDNGGGEGG
eukprot:6367302-Prymnesium_polylepis.1